MKVRIHFHSGAVVDFIAPDNMLVRGLKAIVDAVGGRIRRLEFP